MSVLRNIDLSDNKIVEIPQNIGAFTNLKLLNLNNNLIGKGFWFLEIMLGKGLG